MSTMKPNLQSKPQILSGLLRITSMAAIGILLGIAFGIAVQNLLVGLVLGTGIGMGTGVAIHQRHDSPETDVDQVLWAATPLLIFAIITAFFWI
jgi:hypothetical protein